MWVVVLVLGVSVPAALAQEYGEIGVRVDAVAENLKVPWSIAWTPDGTVLFTERAGHLRVIQDGILQEEPALVLDVEGGEGGLLGVAVDPNYSENGHVYLYYTYEGFTPYENRVARYVYSDGVATYDTTIIDGIPGGPTHDGGRIKFGPDGMLYITTGDAGISSLSQDLDSLGGKVLRVESDGTIPDDNPFGNSPIYSYGHRNPQGLDWDARGNLVITEHGPSGWKGTGHDEINLVFPGSNYGWPKVLGGETLDGMTAPILHTGSDTWAPSGAVFYDSDLIPEWTGKYLVATLRASHLGVIDIGPEGTNVLSSHKVFEGEFGRLRDVAVGPDGAVYILTSNRDGRGYPQSGDDRILRISPLVQPGLEPCNMVSNSSPVFVMTDSKSYGTGDLLRVSGCLDITARSADASIVVMDPDDRIVASEPIDADADGMFASQIMLDDTAFGINGTYTVAGHVGGKYYSMQAFTVPEFGSMALAVSGIALAFLAIWGRLATRPCMNTGG